MIKPVSDLQYYDKIITRVAVDKPAFLTIDDKICYILMDIREYDKILGTIMNYAKELDKLQS